MKLGENWHINKNVSRFLFHRFIFPYIKSIKTNIYKQGFSKNHQDNWLHTFTYLKQIFKQHF